jgi:alpha-tubulin suppressor-like RCC1 family protein
MKDKTFFVWGKNDKGQMGTGTGIGIDMVESENVPVQVNLVDSKGTPHLVKDFHCG